MTVHHHITFAYKRLSGSENIIQTKPRLMDTQTDGHKTHGPSNSNMPPLTSLIIIRQGYLRLQGKHSDQMNHTKNRKIQLLLYPGLFVALQNVPTV